MYPVGGNQGFLTAAFRSCPGPYLQAPMQVILRQSAPAYMDGGTVLCPAVHLATFLGARAVIVVAPEAPTLTPIPRYMTRLTPVLYACSAAASPSPDTMSRTERTPALMMTLASTPVSATCFQELISQSVADDSICSHQTHGAVHLLAEKDNGHCGGDLGCWNEVLYRIKLGRDCRGRCRQDGRSRKKIK